MSKFAASAVILLLFWGMLASCAQPEVTPVITGVESFAAASEESAVSSVSVSSPVSSQPETVSSRSVQSGKSPLPSKAESSAASSAPVASSGTTGAASHSFVSSAAVSSPAPASERANIQDPNLRRYLNTAYFGRPDDETQPLVSEMRSLTLEIKIPQDCGIQTLRGIEAACNIKVLDVSYNPIETLADVDFSSMKQLQYVRLICSKLQNLQGIDQIAEQFISLTVAGEDNAGKKGELADLSGPDWSRFTRLETLDLRGNRISDPTPLDRSFAALQALNLDYNELDAQQAQAFRLSFFGKNPGVIPSVLI